MSIKVNQTLAEQLKLTDREITKRKGLFSLRSEDESLLKACRPMISSATPTIVRRFYDILGLDPEFATVVGDRDSMLRLRSSMKTYILDLFTPPYDSEYVNKRLRIGLVHKRIGVSPSLYMGAISNLISILHSEMDKFGDVSAKDNQKRKLALQKVILFDTQFVFDTYIWGLMSQMETERSSIEEYAKSLEETISHRTKELEELSRVDELTGLFNQRAFFENLRREVSVAYRIQQPVALLYFDLNGFKQLNDKFGHQAGDDMLSLVGDALRDTLRDTDIGCRYGGDEFAVIMPRCTANDAMVFAARLIKVFKERTTDNKVSFSIGIAASVSDQAMDSETLLKCADKAMYAAKKRKKKEAFPIEVVDLGSSSEKANKS